MTEIIKPLLTVELLIITAYIIGVLTYVFTETITNAKFHEGGFLNMGYSTHDNRDVTSKDMWKGLVWPILALGWFVKAIILILNFLMGLFLLIFGIKYYKSQTYKIIENKILDSC